MKARMEHPSRGWVGIAVAMLLLARAGSARGAPAESSAPPPMSEARLNDMALALGRASEVRVRHTITRMVPVTFPTSKRCRYARPRTPFVAFPDTSWVRRCVAAFGLGSRAAGGVAAGFACPPDTSRFEQLELSFETGRDHVTARLNLDAGSVTFRWKGASSGPLPLGERTAELQRLVVEALPSDSSLRTVPICTAARRDTAAARRLQGWVYVDRLPEVQEGEPAVYPEGARQSGVDGTVRVQALIAEDGSVRETAVLDAIPMLDEAAVRAVEQWTFQPAARDGHPTDAWVTIPVRFTLY